MGNRRDDITGTQRTQIALACLAATGKRDGTIQQVAQAHGISRQSVHYIVRRAGAVLPAALEPGPHGPTPLSHQLDVTRGHLRRSVMVLLDCRVPERLMPYCLEQLLAHRPSLGWVSGQVRDLARRAAQVNEAWTPSVGEGLAADELFSHGQPNLLVVGNDSLFIYALTRQPTRDGDTWACVLWDTPTTHQLARDGGTGLGAGAALAERPDQLDWWHVFRDLWSIDASRERKAYGALAEVMEREAQFDQARTPKRLAQHYRQWEKLNQKAEEAIASYDQYDALARQVDGLFAMIEVHTGQVGNVQDKMARLQSLGQEIHSLGGRACTTLGTTLINQAPALCAYLPRLAQALAPLQAQWGVGPIAALCRIWQVEEHLRRGHLSLAERRDLNAMWRASLDEAATAMGEAVFEAWDEVEGVLGLNWRGSNAAECVNSLLRPHLDAHRYTDQEALELRRFLHNVHTFERGKRAGHSPAQLVGLDLPDDPFTLLGLPPLAA